MTPDRELIKLMRQLAMSKQYHKMRSLEQRWLNIAAFEWIIPLEDESRNWAYRILEKYAEEIHL